jgi:carbamoylphosphate synthase large subunit
VRTLAEDFTRRLKSALVGSPDTPLVLLGNFEVEDQWAQGEFGLPRLAVKASRAIANRMDELALLLGGADDYVVLKTAPDEAYVSYLRELKIALPTVLTPRTQDPQRTVTEDALADPGLAAELGQLTASQARLWPHGVSGPEEQLAELTGLALGTPTAAVCKKVNSKIYSRMVADEVGLRQPAGWPCRTMAELSAATEQGRAWLAQGRTVVVKDAYGVSGKGVMVVRDERTLDHVHRMIARRAARSGRDDVALVVEEWVAKDIDLNYQFTVGRDGGVRFDFVKEALTENGVHQGHRMPAALTAKQLAELHAAAQLLGSRLASDRYFGVVGVDALVDPDGGLYPVIEINARNNMSTYQERLRSIFIGAEATALAMQYPMQLRRPMSFSALRGLLDDLLFQPAGKTGLLINNFATVNADAHRPDRSHGASFDGRLYGIVIADSREQATAVDREVRHRLNAANESDTHE